MGDREWQSCGAREHALGFFGVTDYYRKMVLLKILTTRLAFHENDCCCSTWTNHATAYKHRLDSR